MTHPRSPQAARDGLREVAQRWHDAHRQGRLAGASCACERRDGSVCELAAALAAATPEPRDVRLLGHIESLMTMYHEHAHSGPLHGCREVACVESRRLLNATSAATPEPPRSTPDWMAADRSLAVEHREDDQPCGCDECMSYGAEDEGFDWYKVAPPRRIVLRALDSGDDRLAPLAVAFREHEEAR